MYERLIFTTSLERDASRQLILINFPSAFVMYVPDTEANDFILDVSIPVEKCIFFRWAIATLGPGSALIYSCYTMSLELHDPPSWMIVELRRLLTE
jgi:hypothetical protein